MDFALVINNQNLELGQALDKKLLQQANFQKAGLFAYMMNKTPLRQTRFNSNNCTLACFGDGFSVYPCTDGYLTKDRQWATEASLFFQDDRLLRVEFRVVEGHYAAKNFVDRFNDACSEILGEPMIDDRRNKKWKNAKSTVESILHADKINAAFIIELI